MAGMTGGVVRSSSSTVSKGTYRPQGVASSDLNDTHITQTAATEITALEYGTGTGRIDHTTHSDRVLAPGASATYDIYVGTDLKDLGGLTCAFRKVRYLKIAIVDGGDTSGVRIGAAAANEWVGFFAAAGDMYKIFPDGPPLEGGSPAGVAVTSTTKNLKIENLGAVNVTVRIVITGTAHTSGSAGGWCWLWTHP